MGLEAEVHLVWGDLGDGERGQVVSGEKACLQGFQIGLETLADQVTFHKDFDNPKGGGARVVLAAV